MGHGDPDHQHPLTTVIGRADCFRCELSAVNSLCYGCKSCNHYVHELCFDLPQNMMHPHHPQHSLTLLPSPIISSSSQSCNQCLQPLIGGYAYHCQSCLKFNLHLKCFLTPNLKTIHRHPLCLCKVNNRDRDCRICGLPFDHSNEYKFDCTGGEFSMHFECAFLPPKVKCRHVHELTFEYIYPKGSKIFDCDVCLNKDDGKELDRTISYYYCELCDYIAHVRCVTSQPPKVTTQFDHFIHEHPMLLLRDGDYGNDRLCAACKNKDDNETLFFCSLCNYTLHKSCAQFPRFIKHRRHEENHTLSLQSYASQNKDYKQVSCAFCTKELEGKGWIFKCTSDCEFVIHLSCAREFKHPFYENGSLSISFYNEKMFRCNGCGELGDGFRMARGRDYDLHVECFCLPGQIEHGCHSHPLYLVDSPTDIESGSSSVFQCDICRTEVDPKLWVYCCEKCKYFAHLKCVVCDLLPTPGRSCVDLSNFFSMAISEKEKFRVRNTKLDHCSEFLRGRYTDEPFFFENGFFNQKASLGYHNGRSITDLDKSFTDVLCCPKCDKPISTQAYSSVWDWVHRNLKASVYNIQTETPADNESLALLDEIEIDELYCPICNLSIFPPTYSCPDCQIFFHKSCVELPRKYTVDGGHTLVLQSPSMNNNSLGNCSGCKRPCKSYAYFCTSCEIWLDVTCAMGAPLLKLENQKHTFYATSASFRPGLPKCMACHQSPVKGKIYFKCGRFSCSVNLHFECAILPCFIKVKHRIHQHPLVLEPYLDISVDDYICDVCEKKLNPCIWVYRCSDSCGDRATFHVSCVVNSNKKKCNFVYDEECSYPHLIESEEFLKEYGLPSKKKNVPALAAAILNKSPDEEYWFIYKNLLLFVDELEHEYSDAVTKEVMKMSQAEVFHLMESPVALRAKVAEMMKVLTHGLTNADKEQNAEDAEDHQKSP